MKIRLLVIPLVVLSAASCDKAKNLASKATTAVREKIAEKVGTAEADKADPGLQKLVDQNQDGVVFRKDLPFPSQLEVRVTRNEEMAGRFYHASAIDKRSEVLKGTGIHISKLERAGDQVRYTLEQSGFSIPTADGSKEAKQTRNPLEQVAPSVKPVTFRRSGKTWHVENSNEFRTAVLSKEIGPVLDQLLIENALAPRPLWFGKKRMKLGDKVTVAGDSLPMLLAGSGKGSFTLTLQAFESVAGHPCGVFAVTGDYTRKRFPNFEGDFKDEDVSIQSGKIWLSLLHPVVLREELDTIQTYSSGGQGNQVGRSQGSVKVAVKREWKTLK